MIECYFKWCKHHCFNCCPDEGPFCNNQECNANEEQIIEFTKLRDEELKSYETNN